MAKSLPFTHMSASANGDGNKFQQFGWRCTTNETGFKSDTLIGNWNEERYDVKYLAKNKPIPSQFSHYFVTTHKSDFKADNNTGNFPTQDRLLGGIGCEPRTFPRHQPELDPPHLKKYYNTFESTSMATYKDPTSQKS